jgi:hypothetical protein
MKGFSARGCNVLLGRFIENHVLKPSGHSWPVYAEAGQECPAYFACNTPRMMMPWPGKLHTKG